MKQGDPDIVTASDIASWALCPESWRLQSLGHAPGNREALKKGEDFHTRKAVFEERSRSAISLGWWLLFVAVCLAAVALILVRGG
jgi:hypothetical protein